MQCQYHALVVLACEGDHPSFQGHLLLTKTLNTNVCDLGEITERLPFL